MEYVYWDAHCNYKSTQPVLYLINSVDFVITTISLGKFDQPTVLPFLVRDFHSPLDGYVHFGILKIAPAKEPNATSKNMLT